tara:strand:+ start:6372 stop:6677 length:306 start_codon:yes stop_codon:yes gene_type:complete
MKNWKEFINENVKINLYSERYMKSFDYFEDYENLGSGTLFGGDSGYNYSYDDFLEKLKGDIKKYAEFTDEDNDIPINISNLEYVKVDELSVFVKNVELSFD